jgi:hypothetical protein
VSGRALGFAAPFCAGRRDMGANDRAVEKLDQMPRPALLGKQLEKHFEDTRAVEPPETLPDTVPFAELRRQGAPGDIMHGEIMDRLEKLAIIVPGLATAGLGCVEHRKRERPVLSCHLRQHGRLSLAGHAVIRQNPDSGIPQLSMAGIPSTRPKLSASHNLEL